MIQLRTRHETRVFFVIIDEPVLVLLQCHRCVVARDWCAAMMLYVCNDSIGHPLDINAVRIRKFRDVNAGCEHVRMGLLLRPLRRVVVEPWQLKEKPRRLRCESVYSALRAPLIDKLLYLECWMLKV